MAVQPQTPYKEYTANGSTKNFALEFDCENQDHLIVLVDGVEPVVGTWSLIGGAVVFGTTPTSGKKITIQRNTPFRRDGDFQSYDNSFRPGPVNKGFDWVWLKLQELGVADWILSNRIDSLKNYVNQQDGILQDNIDSLKNYVDDKDDELRNYLLNAIQEQGVALDQLEEYYSYLMQQLAQVAIDRGWAASFIVSADGSTQQEINDFGGAEWWDKPLGYKLGATVKLTNGDIAKSTIDGNVNDPNEIQVVKPNTYGWFNETLASTNLHETQTRLLDFIPKQYHAEIFAGNSTRDFSSYINYATNEIRGDLIFPRGVVPIGEPVLLNRGVRFIGNGPFDTITTGSSRIKLLDGANCTAIQTPVAAGQGVSTHFMALENILIDGNNANQTVMKPLVQFHGAWVGSWLRNVFLMNSYGKALEFDKGADVEVNHLWVGGSIVGPDDYAVDFNPSYRGTSVRAGLMNMDHIYIENTGIAKYGDPQSPTAPRNDPSNRGKALNVFALNSMNLNEIHIEGCLRPIDVEATHQTRIGKVSCAFVGKEGVDDVAIVRALGNGMMTLKVDTASITTGKTGTVYGVKKAAGVDLPAIQDRALTGTVPSMVGYEAIASYTADTAKATPPLSVLQTVNVISRGLATPILKFHNSQDLTITSNQYAGLKYTTNGVGLYSTLNQSNNAETVLLDIYTSTTAAGNTVRVYAPLRLIDERATANNIADGAITRVSTSQGKGLAYAFAASSFNFLSTVVVGTSAPTVAPNHIGQMFVDTANKKFYSASGIASSADWVLLN